MTFLLWISCFLLAGFGLSGLVSELPALPRTAQERIALRRVIGLLQEIEETLAAGWVPDASKWAALKALPAPWGRLAHESLHELRDCGGSVLPTLRRLRALALEHEAALAQAKARASQALAQAMTCFALVPVFGFTLWSLLPGVSDAPIRWVIACALSLAVAGGGAAWLMKLAECARWGGLPAASRPWALAAQCAGERFLALVRAGQPADLAWARAIAFLSEDAPALAAAWGASIWASGPGALQRETAPAFTASERVFAEAGDALRKSVQIAVMEGRPCTERAETALLALRQDLRALMDRELSMLGTRALKPLFICVAPSLLVLMAFGFWLSWDQLGGF